MYLFAWWVLFLRGTGKTPILTLLPIGPEPGPLLLEAAGSLFLLLNARRLVVADRI
jgi:hypothetical protein